MNAVNIYDKPSIIKALHEAVDEFNGYVYRLTNEEFEQAPREKWNPGQHLDHLIRSIRPLNLAYALPRFILKFNFGIANRDSKTFTALVEKYKLKLKEGGKASARFVPPAVSFEAKERLYNRYKKEKDKLAKKVQNISETDLDKYILPHPLLGKLTLREMLFFTIYHNVHHLDLVKKYSVHV